MGRLTTIIVCIFLYLQCINANDTFKEKRLYAYNGKILMQNVASDKLASIWTISGKLSVEDLTDHIIFKLEDVKTRIYNGDPSSLNTAQEKLIPEDSKIILEPFLVRPGNTSGYNITHKPEEPIWSLNMKRSIANIFFLNTDRKTNSFGKETTIFGDCVVKYKIANDDKITIMKTINRKNCENDPSFDSSNVEWDPTAKDFEPFKSETKRIYHFDDVESLIKVESISLTTYQSMPGVRSKQIVDQRQEFTQISSTKTFEPTNIADLTETSTIIFDYSKGAEGGRETEVEKKNPDELIEYFSTNYDEFKVYFEKYPLENVDVTMNDTISSMYEALEQMNKDTLLRLGKKIFKRDDKLLQHLFVSYLPYLGTNDSLQYIKNLVSQDEVINDLLTIKILATLPIYVHDIVTEEFVEEMEDLMKLKKVANNQVKYAGILSFASIVSVANAKDVLSLKRLEKYVKIYYKNFRDADNYETKMTWLLGLINLADVLTESITYPIITDTEESRHIRVLAAYGFKDQISSKGSEIYTNMWPIVKNNSEPFEVRVACLDLLLYSKITEEQFNNIVHWYHDELQEPSEQHLANYMYTSLKALQNTTGYYEYLGDYATNVLQNIKPLNLPKAWSTGNYRMAYTDSGANFGASFQARLVSNPVTKILNSAFVTVDSFAHSLNLGRYSAYIKAEGIADMVFSFFALNDDETATVPKLLELIQKNAYRFKEVDNVHIDVVLFSKGRVVFSMHINKYNIDNYTDNPLFIELLSLIIDYNSLSFPVFDYNYLVSDLGTGLQVSTEISEIASYELIGLNQIFNESSSSSEEDDLAECTANYRSIWYYSLYTESYNPLIEASIATYKYVGDEKRVHIPYAFNFTSMLLQWKLENDAINLISDHIIGTMVDDKDILHEYCENCEQISLIDSGEWNSKILVAPPLLSQTFNIKINITSSKHGLEQMALDHMEPRREGYLFELIDQHQSMSFDNMAKPFLLFCHYVTYNKFIANDLYRSSFRSMPYYTDGSSSTAETILELSFDSNDNSNDIHPISKEDLNMTVILTTRKVHDAEVLCHGNLTFRYMSASESNSSDEQPHIHHKYDLELTMSSDTVVNPFKLLIDRNVQYPSRRINKFSLDPVDDTIATTSVSYGLLDSPNEADRTKMEFTITEIYSANEEQKNIMVASNEYKNCKEQSKGLKYIPPTDDCFAAHEIISKYGTMNLYAAGQENFLSNETPIRNDHGILLMRYIQLNDTHLNVSTYIEDLFPKFVPFGNELREAVNVPDSMPPMNTNPRVVAYEDDSLEYGIESACYITPNRIRTFTGHTIKKYYDKSREDSVAFVECSNTTANGMTIQKYSDKYVGFHLYSYNDSLVVSVPDGKLKIEFNNEIITRKNNNLDSEKFKLYYLDNDVIYISSDFGNIFYTIEYISLEMFSITNNYICGLCAEMQHQ